MKYKYSKLLQSILKYVDPDPGRQNCLEIQEKKMLNFYVLEGRVFYSIWRAHEDPSREARE